MQQPGSFNHNYGLYFRLRDLLMGTELAQNIETLTWRAVVPARHVKGSGAVLPLPL